MSQQSQPSTGDARLLVRHSSSPNVADEDHPPQSVLLPLPYRDCITDALHLAVAYQHVPEELILTLLAGNREAAKGRTTSSTGTSGGASLKDLPLHMAIECRYSDRIILALLAAYPEAAQVQAVHRGDLPLHRAIQHGYGEMVVMELFLAYPSAAMIRCKQTGMLPLHLAASSNASPNVVKALINEYPEALDMKANNATPRDLVTSLLPVASMRMICRPSMYWLNILSTVAADEAVAREEVVEAATSSAEAAFANANPQSTTNSSGNCSTGTSTASSQGASDCATSCTSASSTSVAHEDDDNNDNNNDDDDKEEEDDDENIWHNNTEETKKQSSRLVSQDAVKPYLTKNTNNHHHKHQKSNHISSSATTTATNNNKVLYVSTNNRDLKTTKNEDKLPHNTTKVSEEEATTSNTTKDNKIKEGENQALDLELKDSTTAVATTTTRMLEASTITNSSTRREDDGEDKSDGSESTTTLSESKSATSERKLAIANHIADVQPHLEEKEDAYNTTNNQGAPLNCSLNFHNTLLQDYPSRSSSVADPWQEIVARLEHHQGYHHLHHLHHEAAYLASSTAAVSHRLRDTNAAMVTLDGNSNMRSLVRYPPFRDTHDYYTTNDMRSSIVTPLLRSFLQNDYYDNHHMDDVARETKRMKLAYLAQHSDDTGAERLSRDAARASVTTSNSSTATHPTRSHPTTKGNPSVRNKNRPLGVTAMGHMRHYVQHNYHDHSNDIPFSDEAVDLHMRGTASKSPASTSAAIGYSDSSLTESAAATSQHQHSTVTDIHARRGRSPFGVTPMGRMQNVVRHNYHDHSEAVPLEREKEPILLGESSIFPVKLHNLLENVETDGHEGFVSWQPHGRAFKIHNRKKFVELVMPKHFRQSKFESFRRQLCLYGFLTITQGTDKGSLYHELFLRGRPFLAKKIKRQKLKGTIIRTVACPETEPDFYSMPHVHKLK